LITDKICKHYIVIEIQKSIQKKYFQAISADTYYVLLKREKALEK